MERDDQHLGELESVNSGKGVRVARDFDIGDCVACLCVLPSLGDLRLILGGLQTLLLGVGGF